MAEMNRSAKISEINWTKEFLDRGAGHSARRTELYRQPTTLMVRYDGDPVNERAEEG